MKRITLVGLSLLAALAFAAIASSSAFAVKHSGCAKAEKEKVEYEVEKKGEKKKKTKSIFVGAWADKTCSTPAPESKYYEGPEGKYEEAPGFKGPAAPGLVEVTAVSNPKPAGNVAVAGTGPSKLFFLPGPYLPLPSAHPEALQWAWFENNTGEWATIRKAEITTAGETFTVSPLVGGQDNCAPKVSKVKWPLWGFRRLFAPAGAGKHCTVYIVWTLPEGALTTGEYKLEWETAAIATKTTTVELFK